jgi:hypothetical protein
MDTDWMPSVSPSCLAFAVDNIDQHYLLTPKEDSDIPSQPRCLLSLQRKTTATSRLISLTGRWRMRISSSDDHADEHNKLRLAFMLKAHGHIATIQIR